MHSTAAYTMFDTAIGTCAIAWGPRGLLRLQLPERTVAETQRRLLELLDRDAEEQVPPAEVKRVIERVTAQLEGSAVELGDAALDLEVSAFTRRVYEALRRVPRGSTTTYQALASAAGSPGAARAVGRAMATNPLPLIVPCHRVLAAGGAAGGFSAYGGTVTKARLLALEGVTLK